MHVTCSIVLATAVSVGLGGCFQLAGYHKLERYGNSDRGGWQLAMEDATYLMFAASDDFGSFMTGARRFSNPNVRSANGVTYIEDVSGRASMEHIYDSFDCWADARSSRHMICEFTTSDAGLDFAGWAVDWTVELDPDMRMVASNHHRVRTEGGRRQYIWYFDGNRVSAYDIRFRVRVPRA